MELFSHASLCCICLGSQYLKSELDDTSVFQHTTVLCVFSLCVASGGRHLCVSAYNCTLCLSLCVASGGRHLCVSPYNCTLCLSLCVASGGRHLCVSAYNCTLCFISLCSEWWTTPLCFTIQLYFVFYLFV